MKWLDGLKVKKAFSSAKQKSGELELTLLVGVHLYGFQRRALQDNIIRPLLQVLSSKGTTFGWKSYNLTAAEASLLEREASLAAIACGEKIDNIVSIQGRSLLPSNAEAVLQRLVQAEIISEKDEGRIGRSITTEYSSNPQEALGQLIIAWATTLKLDHSGFESAILASTLPTNWNEFRAFLGGAMLGLSRATVSLVKDKSVSILVDMPPIQRRCSIDAIYRSIESGLSSKQQGSNAKKSSRLLAFDPSKELPPEQFISVVVAITRDFTPWVFAKSGLDQNGQMPGGLQMEGTDPTTGLQFNFSEIMSINTEESCFEYCFGLVLFIVLNQHIDWNKTLPYKQVNELYRARLENYITRSAMPGSTIAPETREEILAASCKDSLDMAMFGAMIFWKPYYERMGSLFSNSKKNEPAGPILDGWELMAKWLGTPNGLPGFPLSLLQIRLAKKVTGPEIRGAGWEKRLEDFYGEISRRLIQRAIQLLNSSVAKDKGTIGA